MASETRIKPLRHQNSIPSGYILGRTSGGHGDTELISLQDLGRSLYATGTVGTPGAAAPGVPIPDKDIMSNISGSTASAVGNTITATFDYALGSVQGSMLVRKAAIWDILSPGLDKQVLTMVGATTPTWVTALGSQGMLPLVNGDLPGPSAIADDKGQFIGVPL